MSEYSSSEELQRQRSVFADQTAKKEVDVTETAKLKKMLDRYIEKHSHTSSVRSMAKAANRTAEQQLDLSADLVEILTKIKSELR